MNLFYRRPLALFCACFALASVGGCYLTLRQSEIHVLLACFLFFMSALLVAVPLFLHRFRPQLLTPALALFFAAIALLQSWFFIGSKLQAITEYEGKQTVCRMDIREEYFAKSYLSSYRVELSELDGTKIKTAALLTLPFDAELAAGDVIEGTFSVHSGVNDADNSLYRLADGILLELEAEEPSFSVVGHTKTDPLNQSISELREALSAKLCEFIEGEEGALVSSLFLNKRELLSDQTTLAFRRTGTTHLLAISGMHLSIIILLLEFFLGAVGVKKNLRCMIILLITLFYLALTGFALSACRAFLMCGFVYLSWLFRGDNDPLTSLFFSLFAILALSPYSVADIGMWMSVLAVLGILTVTYFLNLLRTKLKRKGIGEATIRRLLSALSSVCISLAAEIFILFPMWLAFDELSLVALPTGLILSPPVTLVLILTPIMLLVSWIPALATLLGKLLYMICHIILKAVDFFSSYRGVTVSLEYRFFDFFIPISTLIIALLLIIKLKRKWLLPAAIGGSVLALGVFLLAIRLPECNQVAVDYLRQNENELLIFSYDETSVICDSTGGSYSALRESLPLLKKQNSTEISAYVLTHYHKLHASTLDRLFSSFTVRILYLPLPQSESDIAVLTLLIPLAKENGVRVELYDRGSALDLGALSLTVSKEVYLKRSTHPTYYIEAAAFDQTLLYVSEAAHEGETLYQELPEKTARADYAIFGLHGPKTEELFTTPTGKRYTFLADASLLDYFLPQNTSIGKIICGSTQISFILKQDDKK